MSQATKLVFVPKKPAPIEPPPPKGSLWETLERERLKLGWSAREFSRQAGLKSPTHYGLIGTQSGWNASVETQARLLRALFKAGVDLGDTIAQPWRADPEPQPSVTLRRAAAMLQLPPFDYNEKQAKYMVEHVMAFKHDSEIEPMEIALLADYIKRGLDGLGERDPADFLRFPRISPNEVVPGSGGELPRLKR
jgi:transcriptional regulator with XRE-family HTH domain